MTHTDRAFVGAIPKVYDALLVPLIFAPYAEQLAGQVAATAPRRVLEIAAGTGVLTRALTRALPDDTAIVASDLNQAMLDEAAAVGTRRAVEWRQADALRLPWDDGTFDAVACQFGVMFFPDKVQGYREIRRVLSRSGVFLFNVWDGIEQNEFADAVTAGVATVFPSDPPRFLPRVAHGYADRVQVAQDLEQAGFGTPRIETVTMQSRADTARSPALAFCQGTPLRNEIETRDPGRLGAATDAATAAVAERFGDGPVLGRMQAHVVRVAR